MGPAKSELLPTTEDNEVLAVAGVTAYPQNNVFETAVFRVVVKLALHSTGQVPDPLRQMGSERRVVFLDDPMQQGLLGTLVFVGNVAMALPGLYQHAVSRKLMKATIAIAASTSGLQISCWMKLTSGRGLDSIPPYRSRAAARYATTYRSVMRCAVLGIGVVAPIAEWLQ